MASFFSCRGRVSGIEIFLLNLHVKKGNSEVVTTYLRFINKSKNCQDIHFFVKETSRNSFNGMTTSREVKQMKNKLSLITLAIGTFALGIAEFSMMGILSDVVNELRISVSTAGHLISAYSFGVATGAPMLIFMRRMPLRKVLLILAIVITAGNAFAAVAPEFYTLLCARFISGLPHGAFFGCGSIVAARLAEKGHGAEAVAIMIGGMTVANVIGVPSATFISNAIGWRWAFAMVAFSGLSAVIAIRSLVPIIPAMPDTGVKGQFRFLKSSAPWLIYGGVFFGQASVYCWLSYVSPIMTRITGFTLSDMTWIMMLIGVGMVAGNYVAGKMADRHSPGMVSATIAAVLAVVMGCIYFTVDYKVITMLLAFVASAGLFGIGGPPQFLIVGFSKGGVMLGGAGIQIAFNVSNACSAAIGGLAIHHGLVLASPAIIGVPFAVVGFVCFTMLHRKYRTQGA